MITRLRSFRFRLPLTGTLQLRHSTVTAREGLLIELTDDRGFTALGECSPLPGFFQESVDDCAGWLRSQRAAIVGQSISELPMPPFPSLKAGLEQAAHWLECLFAGRSPFVSSASSPVSIPVNALLTGSRETILQKAANCAAQGYRAAKLKVGARPVHEEVALVREVRTLLPDSISLRLDANQRWSFADALQFGRALDWSGIEYCEEPLAEPSRLSEYVAALPEAKIALDESFSANGPGLLDLNASPAAVILRPQLLGGLAATKGVIDLLESRRIPMVISSAFESTVGLLSLLSVAAMTPGEIRPAGLDTVSWLAADSVTPSLRIENGMIACPDWWHQLTVNESVGEWHEY